MSAASFLGIAGLIALYGYDGFLYSIGFLVAWLVALLLVAELLRNSGRYTMADVLAFRMRQRPVRTAAGVSTITVSIFYLLAQMVGAGALVALLLGSPGTTFLHGRGHRKVATIVVVGALMIIYVDGRRHEGHHLRPDRQGVPADERRDSLMTLLVLRATTGSTCPSLLGDAAHASGKGSRLPRTRPPLRRRDTGDALRPSTARWTCCRLGIALVLGTAGLPHILIRFYTVPTARAARKSVLWAIGIIGVFYLLTLARASARRRWSAGRRSPRRTRRATRRRRMLAEALGKDFFGGSRRHDAAGGHRGGRLRHHPGGGRRADPGLVVQPWRTTSTPT